MQPASLAANIPPELFQLILTSIDDSDGQGWPRGNDIAHTTNNARREGLGWTMRSLSTLASVCVYWARLVRPRMFHTLVLRSAKDLYGLLALLRLPPPPTGPPLRIQRIQDCVRGITVYYHITDYFWCHSLHRICAEEGMHRALELRVHVTGRAPARHIPSQSGVRPVRHPLFRSLPRPVPFYHNAPFRAHLFLEKVVFTDESMFSNFIQDIIISGLLPLSVTCVDLDWTGQGIGKPPKDLMQPKLQFNQRSSAGQLTVSVRSCTDDRLAIRAAYRCLREPHQTVHLSLSEYALLSDMWQAELKNVPLPSSTVVEFFPQVCVRKLENRGMDMHPIGYGSSTGLSDLYKWMLLSSISQRLPYNQSAAQFGCRARVSVVDGASTTHTKTAHISSVQLGLYNLDAEFYNLGGVIESALAFPRLSVLEIYVRPRRSLRAFAMQELEMLTELDEQGKLRLYVCDTQGALLLHDGPWVPIALSDAVVASAEEGLAETTFKDVYNRWLHEQPAFESLAQRPPSKGMSKTGYPLFSTFGLSTEKPRPDLWEVEDEWKFNEQVRVDAKQLSRAVTGGRFSYI